MAEAPRGLETFIQDLNSQVLALIKDIGSSPEERRRRLQRLLEERFDLETMARLALGRHWRRATPAFRDAYTAVFARLVLYSHVTHLESVREAIFVRHNNYTERILENLKIQVKSTRKPDGRDSIVVTTIQLAERPPIQIAYRVRSVNGELKIVNVTRAGLNLVVTRRAEFAAIVRMHSLQGLLSRLQARVDFPDGGDETARRAR
jgi:ABC-type transporter MlaC component